MRKTTYYIREMLEDLENAMNLAGYDVSLVYDKEDHVIEASNLDSYSHILLHLEAYPEVSRGDYRNLLFDIIKAIRETEN